MGQIGNLGKTIVFEVSDEKVLTFSRFTKTVKGRWGTHTPISGKPESEFLGPDLQDGSFDVYLSVMHGVRPRKTMENIEKAVLKGKVLDFALGGKKIGSGKWKILSVSETWDCVYSKGELISAKASLTLQEY